MGIRFTSENEVDLCTGGADDVYLNKRRIATERWLKMQYLKYKYLYRPLEILSDFIDDTTIFFRRYFGKNPSQNNADDSRLTKRLKN